MNIPSLIEQNKPIFAAYTTMAITNIATVFNHIRNILNIAPGEKDDGDAMHEHSLMKLLETASKRSADVELLLSVVERLRKQMPFLAVMEETGRKKSRNTKQSEDIKYLYNILKNIFYVLKLYRDFSEHTVFEDKRLSDTHNVWRNEREVAQLINKYFEVALRNAKDRFGYETAQLAFIQDHRYKKESDSRSSRPKMVPDTSFFLSMLSPAGGPGDYHLSGAGAVLLISLFLESKYVNVFLSKLPRFFGRYAKGSAEARIIYRTFAINGIRLPRERIVSDNGEMAIALDMLNELKRCPQPLFDTLSPDDQAQFRLTSSDFNEVLLMRHSDRFAQLSLRYIDTLKLFADVRFQVNMGKLRYLFNPTKECIDGNVRPRVLEHPLNGFGRIDEMEARRVGENGRFLDTAIAVRRFEDVRRDDSDPANYPYVVDDRTDYIISNNKIGLTLVGDTFPQPVEDEGKWRVENCPPMCFLSILELPAMMFHMHLLGAEATERRLKQVNKSYGRLFSAMEAGTLTRENLSSFGIAESDLPAKVLEAVHGTGKTPSFKAFVKQSIVEMIADTNHRLERLKEDEKAVDSKMNKMGKRGFRAIRPGKIAEFLAEDIVRFQESALTDELYGTDRITGLNYRVMQAAIATLNDEIEGRRFDDLKSLFAKAHLTGKSSRTPHPFLFSALGRPAKNTIDFYRNYLFARKRYLEDLRKRLDAGEKVKITFANSDNSRWMRRDKDFYRNVATEYKEFVPLDLPRQMFDAEIKAALAKMPEMEGVNFAEANVTFLIGEYLKRVRHDDFQPFYSWKRNYRYIDLLTCRTDNKGSICSNYTTIKEREQMWLERAAHAEKYRSWAMKQRLAKRETRNISEEEFGAILDRRLSASRNDYQKAEKMIRRFKVQDALMLLMAKEIFTRYVDFGSDRFKLATIMPDADKGILSEIMPIDFTFIIGGKRRTVYSKAMKIKNYGDFFRLVNDRRITSLFDIVEEVRVEKEGLETELNNYDDCRPKVLSLIIDFEKLIYERFPDLKLLSNSDSRVGFTTLASKAVERGSLSSADMETLRNIRNSFSHNKYPEKAVVRISAIPEIAIHLLELFGEKAKLD